MSALDTLWIIGVFAAIGYLFLQVWDDTFGEALRYWREQERRLPPAQKPRPYDWKRDMDA